MATTYILQFSGKCSLFVQVILSVLVVVAPTLESECIAADSPSRLHYMRTIEHPSGTTESHFGTRLWFQNDTLLVGAPREFNGPFVLGNVVGAAYSFTKEGQFIARFDNPEPDPEDRFGEGGVILSNGNVVIGAHQDDTIGDDAGMAYMFNPNGDFIREIESPSIVPDGSFFGRKIVQVDEEIFIAAHADGTQGFDRGAIHVFDLDGEFRRTILPDQEIAGGGFGIRLIRSSGDELIVGVMIDDGEGDNAGAAYVIDLFGNVKRRIGNPDPRDFDRFSTWGMESMPEDFILLGSLGENDDGTSREKMYFFDVSGELLGELIDPFVSHNNWYGRYAESVHDEFFVVTSLFDDSIGENSGAIHLYNSTGALLETIYSPDEASSKFYGGAVTIDDDYVYVGEGLAEVDGVSNVGAVHIYEIVFNPGDANWDGVVDLLDFNALKDAFGAGSHFREGDFDRDDDVDLDDFAILKESFGNRYNGDEESPVVPEPNGHILAAAGAAAFLLRRRMAA